MSRGTRLIGWGLIQSTNQVRLASILPLEFNAKYGKGRRETGLINVTNKKKNRRNVHPRRTLFGRLRAYLLAGILVTAPIGITLWMTWGIIAFFDHQVMPFVPAHYNPVNYLPIPLPGLGLMLALIILILIGWLAAGLMGRWLVRLTEQVMARMPIVRNVHSAVKQIMETVLAQNANAFRHVVLVEYPRRGIWTMGFVTGTTVGEVQHVVDVELVNVFVPTTPNPTSGFLLFVPKKDLYYLSMTSEEGFKMLVSTGIVTPTDRRSAERQAMHMIRADNDAQAERHDTPAQVLDGGEINLRSGIMSSAPLSVSDAGMGSGTQSRAEAAAGADLGDAADKTADADKTKAVLSVNRS